MTIRNALFASLIPASALLVACGGGGSSSGGSAPVNGEDRTATVESVKANYVDMAYAAYSDSLTTGQALQAAVDAFLADPSEAKQDAAKAAYKAARIPYQQTEIMRWDTAITIDSDLAGDGVGPASVDDWEGQVNAWPLDENHIKALIAGTETIDIALLLAQNGAAGNEANVTTGVHAIEFLLWGSDGPGAAAFDEFPGLRAATDYALSDIDCTSGNCERRAAYLKAATDLLIADLADMAAEWSPEAANTQGSLAYNFLVSSQALDYMLGAMKSMATDELASARMGSGLELGDPEEEHDCFSDLSHVAIYNNLQSVRNAFYGSYGTISGDSFGDLVEAKDSATFDKIDAALDSIETKMKQLLDAGERDNNPIHYDQIIGQDTSGAERQLAESIVNELIALDADFHSIKELLSLTEINVGGSGDGD